MAGMAGMAGVLAAAVAGLIAGIAVAMPLGAIGVLLVQEGMSSGWRSAAAGATGVALVDLGYCAVAVAAGTSLSRALAGWETAIHLGGAALLVAVAARGLLGLRAASGPGLTRARARPGGALPRVRSRPRVRAARSRHAGRVAAELPALAPTLPAPTVPGPTVPGPVWRTGLRFAGLTSVNPLTAVYFVALAAGLGHALDGHLPAAAFVLAVFVASWAWQLTLAGFGAVAGTRLPAGARQVTGAAGYLLVLGYAAHLALS